MNRNEMVEILKSVTYKPGWIFHVKFDTYERLYLQLTWITRDWPVPSRQSGRKWFLSEHMTKSELVQTALKAVLAAEEHEARELFMYKLRPIFGPHHNVDRLWDVANDTDERKPNAD